MPCSPKVMIVCRHDLLEEPPRPGAPPGLAAPGTTSILRALDKHAQT